MVDLPDDVVRLKSRTSVRVDSDSTEIEPLRAQLAALTKDQETLEEDWRFANSPAMRIVKATIDRVAPTDVTVLVWGESGVGKEIIPKLLHWNSPRRGGPFVKVNCAALPLELLESELFGYERGAFTGADRQKTGKFEFANKGTIFLDEIGELPWPLQAKLLHILQDREFARLGSARTIRADVRVVAATNKDLAQRVQQRLFRDDLYYRLNVVNVRVPALRQRREEIPFLVDHFLRKFGQQYGCGHPNVRSETLQHFLQYEWPGNVRELENTIKRIVVLGTEAWVLEELRHDSSTETPDRRGCTIEEEPPAAQSLTQIGRRAAAEAERLALTRVLEEVHWNRTEAARRLKVNYKTILAKIEEYQIGHRRPDSRAS